MTVSAVDERPTPLEVPPRPASKRWASVARRALKKLASADTVVVTFFSVLAALIVGAIIMIVTTPVTIDAWGRLFSQPGTALSSSWDLVSSAYGSLLSGSLGSLGAYRHAFGSRADFANAFYPLPETVVDATPYWIGGIGVAIAMRAGLFNIGGQGQMIVGAIAASAVGLAWPKLPLAPHLALVLVGALAAGAAFGWVPGVLRAKAGAHEVIVTLMLDYIALNLLLYVLTFRFFVGKGQNALSLTMPPSATLPLLAGTGLRVNVGAIIGLAAVVFGSVLLSRTVFGFRLRLVGASPAAARASGVNSGRAIILALALSGAILGLAGGVEAAGVAPNLVANYGGTIGFNAVIVALLGRGKPLGVLLAALLFGMFDSGGTAMQAATPVSLDLVQVVESVIVLFITAPVLVRAIFHLPAPAGGVALPNLGGWGGAS